METTSCVRATRDQAAVLGVAYGVLIITVFVRGGLVAVAAFIGLAYFLQHIVLTTDLTTWYAPYTVLTVLGVLAVTAYGAWAALTGRER